MTTEYVVRHVESRHFWTGEPDGWSPKEANARRFEFMTDATMVAYRDVIVEPSLWYVEPIDAIDVEGRR